MCGFIWAVCLGLTLPSDAQVQRQADALKLHNIFSSHMVLQRDKPIKVWGWATPGQSVTVQLGTDSAQTKVQPESPVEVFGHEKDYEGLGRWEVTFPAREANAEPTTLTVTCLDEKVVLEDILIGDVWVMYGQSNMAFSLSKTNGRELAAQANNPLLRLYSITNNEQSTLQDDIRPGTVDTEGWAVSSPETALSFSAIGYVFGANVQRATGVPIGVLKNARGGASIESMVPLHKFDDHPIAKRYADYVQTRIDAFDPEAEADRMWEGAKARAKRKNQPEPERPDPANLRSWNVPGKSPSDRASVYNGYFGVFKGFNIKGVLFHQGFNNALSSNCRPKRYRVLTRLMVEGIRADFNDPQLAFGIIGFCAGGKTQNRDNFEADSYANGPYIREAQRLGLADVDDQTNLVFIPAYDVQVPGLHPGKKREHGYRAARWALSEIYDVQGVNWEEAEVVSVERQDDVMLVTFDKRVYPDDRNSIVEGFSIAGEDGKFYMAHARHVDHGKKNYWDHGHRQIRVWSPLVEEPVAIRYGWATSPMGNLKVNGSQDQPFYSFRTDTWDLPESDDPAENAISGTVNRDRKAEAAARLAHRRLEEAKRAVELIERLETLDDEAE
jgi:sialate O-acetylesterase